MLESRGSESPDVRQAAVAGTFYESDPVRLRRHVEALLRDASVDGPVPKAMILPHAGYRYSGPVAASGYSLLAPIADRIERVVLLGPSHGVAFRGLAAPSAGSFATPLGLIPVDRGAVLRVRELPQVEIFDLPHQNEHSLEVHLPFLAVSLPSASLVPLAVGQAEVDEVAEVLSSLWDGQETLIIVSSDLSHYRDYETARAIDRETSRLIEHGQWERLDGERACGFCGIRGLLMVAAKHGLSVDTIDLRNSGDTSGDRSRVVGYGAYVVHEGASS